MITSAAATSQGFRGGSCLLARTTGFWGVSHRIFTNPSYHGVRRGDGVFAAVPAEARKPDARGDPEKEWVFESGDRVGLDVDMDARTMTMLRNGEPVPSLVFEGLPDEVFVAGTHSAGTCTTVRILTDV